MNAGGVSTSASSVHVALWGNGAVPSALKGHETGALCCVCLGWELADMCDRRVLRKRSV